MAFSIYTVFHNVIAAASSVSLFTIKLRMCPSSSKSQQEDSGAGNPTDGAGAQFSAQ